MDRPQWVQKLPWDLVVGIAVKHRLEPELVAAVIQTESGGNPFAMRVEMRHKLDEHGYPMMTPQGNYLFVSLWKYFTKADTWAELVGSSKITEWIGQLTSFGPMQIMGTVAREHGFRGWFPELCSWELGLEYGCRHLARKQTLYGDDPTTLYAAYNGGTPSRLKSGMFQNQKNVDHFHRNYLEITQ